MFPSKEAVSPKSSCMCRLARAETESGKYPLPSGYTMWQFLTSWPISLGAILDLQLIMSARCPHDPCESPINSYVSM